MLKCDKLFDVLKANGYNYSRIRKENLIGQATYYALKHGICRISWQTIDKVCRACNCQPGDIMEYVEDDSIK